MLTSTNTGTEGGRDFGVEGKVGVEEKWGWKGSGGGLDGKGIEFGSEVRKVGMEGKCEKLGYKGSEEGWDVILCSAEST